MSDSSKRGVSRRGFVVGSALSAMAAGVAAALGGCSKSSSDDGKDGKPQVITDNSKIISVTDDYKYKSFDMKPVATWTLPLGTLLFHSDGPYCAAMMAPESARHVNTLGVLSLESGTLTTLLEEPVHKSNYGFFDVRCATGIFAWVEMNFSTLAWTLYAQPLSQGTLTGKPIKIDHGNKNYEPAQFETVGSTIIWYKMPTEPGAKATEESVCYLRGIGDTNTTEIWRSTGRFGSKPHVSDKILTITPRVRNSEGVYYGMTAIDLANNNVKRAQLVLPSGVKPFEAVYFNDVFAFSIEQSYSDVGSLGEMGTYIGVEGGPYLSYSREPFACVCGKGTRYVVKTKSSHVIFDSKTKTYDAIASPDRTVGFGDFPATQGKSSKFVTFSATRDAQGIPESVTARVFEL